MKFHKRNLIKTAAMITPLVWKVCPRIDEDILCLDSYEEIKCYITGILDENLSMDSPSAAKSDRELFGQIKDLVLQNLEHNYSLQEICGMFHVSQPYVRKTFIRYTAAHDCPEHSH